MTIRNTLTEIYPDLQFMGTRQLGTKYVLSRGMRGYFVSNRLTGTVVCTWDLAHATTRIPLPLVNRASIDAPNHELTELSVSHLSRSAKEPNHAEEREDQARQPPRVDHCRYYAWSQAAGCHARRVVRDLPDRQHHRLLRGLSSVRSVCPRI